MTADETPSPLAHLTALRDQLSLWRRERAHYRKAAAELRLVLETEHAATFKALADADRRTTEAELELRAAALRHHELYGNKKPIDGITVIDTVALSYDEAEALTWARESGLALRLDVTVFETIAKASSLPFVKAQPTHAVRIAADLPCTAAPSTAEEVSRG